MDTRATLTIAAAATSATIAALSHLRRVHARRDAVEQHLVALAWSQEHILLTPADRTWLRTRGYFTQIAVDVHGDGLSLALLTFQRGPDGTPYLTVERHHDR